MKKEYTKPLVTVVTLIADRHIAGPFGWDDYKSENDLMIGDEELDKLL